MSTERALRLNPTPENKPAKQEKKSLGPSAESFVSTKKLSGEVGLLTQKINDLEGDLKLAKFSKNAEEISSLTKQVEAEQTALSTKLYELNSALSQIDEDFAAAGVEPTDPKRMEYAAQKSRAEFLSNKLQTDRDSDRIHQALKTPELPPVKTPAENTTGTYQRFSSTLGRMVTVGGKGSEQVSAKVAPDNVNMTAAELNRLADEQERSEAEELALETAHLRDEVQSPDDGTTISRLQRKSRVSPSGGVLPKYTPSENAFNIDTTGDEQDAEWASMMNEAKRDSVKAAAQQVEKTHTASEKQSANKPAAYENMLDEMLTAKKPSRVKEFFSGIANMFKRAPKLEDYDENQPPQIPTPDQGARSTYTETIPTMNADRVVRVTRSSEAYTNRETGGRAEFPHEATARKIQEAVAKKAAQKNEEDSLEELPADAITPDLAEDEGRFDAAHFEQLSSDLDTIQEEILNGPIDSFESLMSRLNTLGLRSRMNEILPPKAHDASLESLMGKRTFGIFGKPKFDKKTAAAYLQNLAGDAANRSIGII